MKSTINQQSKPIKILRWILIFLAITLPWMIFIAGLIWPSGPNDGADVKARPPVITFAIVWSLIVVFYIIAWVLIIVYTKSNTKVFVASLTFILFITGAVLWQYVYHKIGVKEGAWVLWLTVFFAILVLVMSIKCNWISAILVSLAVAWGLYAAVLNTVEAQISVR